MPAKKPRLMDADEALQVIFHDYDSHDDDFDDFEIPDDVESEPIHKI